MENKEFEQEVKNGKISISLIQRLFGVGYPTARYIILALITTGVVKESEDIPHRYMVVNADETISCTYKYLQVCKVKQSKNGAFSLNDIIKDDINSFILSDLIYDNKFAELLNSAPLYNKIKDVENYLEVLESVRCELYNEARGYIIRLIALQRMFDIQFEDFVNHFSDPYWRERYLKWFKAQRDNFLADETEMEKLIEGTK